MTLLLKKSIECSFFGFLFEDYDVISNRHFNSIDYTIDLLSHYVIRTPCLLLRGFRQVLGPLTLFLRG